MEKIELSRRSLLQLAGAGTVAATAAAGLGASPAAAAPATGVPLPQPLSALDKPNLSVATVPSATIESTNYRVSFYQATWDGGLTYLRELWRRARGGWQQITAPDHLFDEQWVILTGTQPAFPGDYYTSSTPQWVAFESLHQVDAHTVTLEAVTTEAYAFTVQWSLGGEHPQVHWTLTANQDGHFVVGYQALDAASLDEVDEVLCGTRQHARVVNGVEALGAWELMAPMCLTQHGIAGTTFTTGVYIPASVITFEHEREQNATRQPFAMSLRNQNRDVQPVVYAPQAGDLSAMSAGDTKQYSFAIYASAAAMPAAYTDLVRHEYRYSAYRRNAYDTSLTTTMFNLIDLAMRGPDGDDSTTFVPSPSGWWNRAKGFIDVENDQAVRTATAGVLLSAYLLTGDEDIYQQRARPIMEYQVSRGNIGYTPDKTKSIYGVAGLYRLGSVPGDASTLVPLYRQTGGRSGGLHALAMLMIQQRPVRDSRTPMSTPLQAYELTGNPAYLAEAKAEGARYIAAQIEPPYTTNQPDSGFQYNYVKAWTELLMLYEASGERSFLDAAYREAQRFITQTQVRPVPETRLEVPNQPFLDNQFNGWVESPGIWDYPLSDVPSENVPAWLVATNGMTFEQLSTFKLANPVGGFVMLPCWAPFFLRLAHHTGDTLLADVAHNLVVGRYTNYPGYYNRQFGSWHIHPDFPLVGPPGESSIYYSHIPGQLGLTIDYLVTEHTYRSHFNIEFPGQFETNYVYFKFRTYGHAPGRFYGADNVWPYLPKGIATVSNPQLNWLTAEGNGNLYLSLTNEAESAQTATVTFDPALAGIDRAKTYRVEVIRDNGARVSDRLRNGRLDVTVSARGITAVIVSGVSLKVPLHRLPAGTDNGTSSYHFDDASPLGIARGLLFVRPDRSGYDAYLQVDNEALATLRYSTDDGATWQELPNKVYPNEWTVPVADLNTSFRYAITVGTTSTAEATLRVPTSVTGVCPPGVSAAGEVAARADTTAGDVMRVTAVLRNGSHAAFGHPHVVLALPTGWTSKPVGRAPATVPAGGSAPWTYDVTAPADAPAATVTIGASATWAGGAVDLTPAQVRVLASLSLPAVVAAPAQLANPGDATTVTVSVLNVGPLRRTGTLTISVPSGFTAAPASLNYRVAGRSEQAYPITVSSSAGVARQVAYPVTATLDTGAHASVTVQVASNVVTVDVADPWPSYVETGQWLASSLLGFDGTVTRYSNSVGSTATWQPVLNTAGAYTVAVWYPNNATSTRAAVYVVHHADGEDTFTVDQQDQASQWRVLGTFNFAAGDDGYVQLQVHDTAFHRADAARFTPVGG
ncbi:hypothetical protein GCM10023322_28810 [Rugosimonospora acidiphila]|uniref:Golvesin/Xly CBD-like domain-containing protein n=1 Tax=Rugosimonospora acidiphila TaxID=556531 RepID=A0ABP9RT81_9ACTN